MKRASIVRLVIVSICAMCIGSSALSQTEPGKSENGKEQQPFSPSASPKARIIARGQGAIVDKLDLTLRLLTNELTTARGTQLPTLTGAERQRLFGIGDEKKKVIMEVAITATSDISREDLKKAGAVIRYEIDGTIFASVPLSNLLRVANLPGVEYVKAVNKGDDPKPQIPVVAAQFAPTKISARDIDEFDKHGLTGKGVIVGVVDTGIDWKHSDFLRADGTSRVLYLYDMTDNSYSTSNGGVGFQPPYTDNWGNWMGTLYNNKQINNALSGFGTVNSYDIFGHGTACAGVAAGNDTTGAVFGKSYSGIAPEADLIVVRAGVRNFPSPYHLGIKWIADTAKQLGRPCVINVSIGGHGHAHDGRTAEEELINGISGPGKPGVAVCISAGNDRKDSFHASGRFGSDSDTGAGRFSKTIDLIVTEEVSMLGYFNPQDDWTMAIRGKENVLVTPQGEEVVLFAIKNGGYVQAQTEIIGRGVYYGDIISKWLSKEPRPYDGASFYNARFYADNIGRGQMSFKFPPGRYQIYVLGNGNVKDGNFDLYLANAKAGSFAKGNEQQLMVSAPGNARNAITVGSYDFRNMWTNANGGSTIYNNKIGGLSDYSNPGYSRSGTIKPDIVAPAQFAISALSRAQDGSPAEMSGFYTPDKRSHITADEKHVAWNGTSAAAPYVAGVVALMFEKNPNLDASQIKDILKKTATTDFTTGGVPNRDWGYGKIDPAAAIEETQAGF